ncbi:MAG: hypothetical protein N4A57_05085 [Anaeromicrobium sp.]|jgi:hypothetical protein|uniref:hypothetical protein n=1 Tax=Anaeromicrobium sp. TaxID=1929132 RepID=UPI0025D4FDBF|nr:hypothetical protein [Anaeromicrobium sp.]MCT4593628.1 hypothetical protein [Anaeromicrobium sp.]
MTVRLSEYSKGENYIVVKFTGLQYSPNDSRYYFNIKCVDDNYKIIENSNFDYDDSEVQFYDNDSIAVKINGLEAGKTYTIYGKVNFDGIWYNPYNSSITVATKGNNGNGTTPNKPVGDYTYNPDRVAYLNDYEVKPISPTELKVSFVADSTSYDGLNYGIDYIEIYLDGELYAKVDKGDAPFGYELDDSNDYFEYIIRGLEPNTRYTIGTRCYDYKNRDETTWYGDVFDESAYTDPLIILPSAPSYIAFDISKGVNGRSENNSKAGVYLKWENASNADNYDLYWNDRDHITVNDTTTHLNNVLDYGRTYTFKVYGHNQNGLSTSYASALGTTAPKTPTIKASKITDTGFIINVSDMISQQYTPKAIVEIWNGNTMVTHKPINGNGNINFTELKPKSKYKVKAHSQIDVNGTTIKSCNTHEIEVTTAETIVKKKYDLGIKTVNSNKGNSLKVGEEVIFTVPVTNLKDTIAPKVSVMLIDSRGNERDTKILSLVKPNSTQNVTLKATIQSEDVINEKVKFTFSIECLDAEYSDSNIENNSVSREYEVVVIPKPPTNIRQSKWAPSMGIDRMYDFDRDENVVLTEAKDYETNEILGKTESGTIHVAARQWGKKCIFRLISYTVDGVPSAFSDIVEADVPSFKPDMECTAVDYTKLNAEEKRKYDACYDDDDDDDSYEQWMQCMEYLKERKSPAISRIIPDLSKSTNDKIDVGFTFWGAGTQVAGGLAMLSATGIAAGGVAAATAAIFVAPVTIGLGIFLVVDGANTIFDTGKKLLQKSNNEPVTGYNGLRNAYVHLMGDRELGYDVYDRTQEFAAATCIAGDLETLHRSMYKFKNVKGRMKKIVFKGKEVKRELVLMGNKVSVNLIDKGTGIVKGRYIYDLSKMGKFDAFNLFVDTKNALPLLEK